MTSTKTVPESEIGCKYTAVSPLDLHPFTVFHNYKLPFRIELCEIPVDKSGSSNSQSSPATVDAQAVNENELIPSKQSEIQSDRPKNAAWSFSKLKRFFNSDSPYQESSYSYLPLMKYAEAVHRMLNEPEDLNDDFSDDFPLTHPQCLCSHPVEQCPIHQCYCPNQLHNVDHFTQDQNVHSGSGNPSQNSFSLFDHSSQNFKDIMLKLGYSNAYQFPTNGHTNNQQVALVQNSNQSLPKVIFRRLFRISNNVLLLHVL